MKPFRVRAILFDFDGTLTHPDSLDLRAFARKVGCPDDQPLLEWIASKPDQAERTRLNLLLVQFEDEAAASSRPNQGAEQAVLELRAMGLAVGILTRNGRTAIDRALANFERLSPKDFDVIITRDSPLPPKPAPDGILIAGNMLGVPPSEIMVVGDYVLDLTAAKEAGAISVLLCNRPEIPAWADKADHIIHSLDELPRLAAHGVVLPQGKLPQPLLRGFLSSLCRGDSSVVVPPAIGEDVACVALSAAHEQAELLALKTDPITFATAKIPDYAIRVNSNDLATCGALARWMLACVLFPCGTTWFEAQEFLKQLAETANRAGITLCGGHSEITDAVTRPVVVGSMAGVLARTELKDKKKARPGDCVVLTKRVTPEGTALLAYERAKLLRARGITDEELARARTLLASLSVMPEARVAASIRGVRAMHDVTEGGLATAINELAAACGLSVQVDLDCIPYYAETVRICETLGANPLGLIGSGNLLIVCAEEDTERLLTDLREAKIEANVIGHLGGSDKAEVTAVKGGEPAAWPKFRVDELARILSETKETADTAP